MGNEKQTLRQYLDSIGVKTGDDRNFLLYDGLFSQTQMCISRRYIESEPWKHLLDKNIFGTQEGFSPFGQRCLVVILE